MTELDKAIMNQHFERPHSDDRDDPLTFFDSERDIADFSSSSKTTTFSALAEFREESHSPADNGATPATPLDVRVETLAAPASVEAAAPPTILGIAAVARPKVETTSGSATEPVPARARAAARERETWTAPMGTGARRRATVRASPGAVADERAAAATLAHSKRLERAMATASTSAASRTAAQVSSRRVRWVISLAVLVPPAATLLVFGTPLLSTAGLDRCIPPCTTVAGTAGIQQETHRELAAMLPSAPAPSFAPHMTDPVVTEALNQAERTEPIVLAATDERRQPAPQESSQPAASPRRSSATVTQAGSVRLASPAAPRLAIQSTVPAAAIRVDPIPPLAARPAGAFPIETPNRRGFHSVISIDTAPGGAHVFVDGRYVGVTPVVWDVAAGSHVVRIEHEGYERWSGAVRAVAEKTLNIAVKLLPARQQ